MSDVVVQGSARTYPVPRRVRLEAQHFSSSDSVGAWYRRLLTSGSPLTAEMISLVASIAKRPALSEWCDKIQKGAGAERDRTLITMLASADYDQTRWSYIGIADQWRDDVVRTLCRVSTTAQWERWNGSGWEETEPGPRRTTYDMDPELVAFVASSLAEVDGVAIKLNRPVARLPHEPVLAAGPPLEMSEEEDPAPFGAHYYAIVDPTDATAVMDLIEISPGPVIRVRDGGRWNVDSGRVQELKGPPVKPLVELDPETLELVTNQVDGKFDEQQTNPEYVESIGHEAEIDAAEAETQPAENLAAKNDEAVAASALDGQIAELRAENARALRAFDRRLAKFRESEAVTAAGGVQKLMTNEAERRRGHVARLKALLLARERMVCGIVPGSVGEALEAAGGLRAKLAALEMIRDRIPVAAVETDTLRRYWSRDCGSLKVAWCEQAPIAAAGYSGNGSMVAFYPDKALAKSLALGDDDAEAMSDLHVTLTYLGKAKDVDRKALNAAVKYWAKRTAPVQVTIDGTGNFDNRKSRGEFVTYAKVHAGQRAHAAKRSLDKQLEQAGTPDATDHEQWIPHVTLAYDDKPDAKVPKRDVTFREVWVVHGDDRRRYPLTGDQ